MPLQINFFNVICEISSDALRNINIFEPIIITSILGDIDKDYLF